MFHPSIHGISSWVFALILALAAALGFVFLVASFQYYFAPTEQVSDISDPDKMAILESLSGSSDITESEKQSVIDALSEEESESEVSAEAKMQLLDRLNTAQ